MLHEEEWERELMLQSMVSTHTEVLQCLTSNAGEGDSLCLRGGRQLWRRRSSTAEPAGGV